MSPQSRHGIDERTAGHSEHATASAAIKPAPPPFGRRRSGCLNQPSISDRLFGDPFPIALRVTLVLFWLQMVGTFLTLVVLPELAFQGGNPLLLSVLGEFVVKNIVLMAAGLVIGASIRRRARSRHASTSFHSLPQSEGEIS